MLPLLLFAIFSLSQALPNSVDDFAKSTNASLLWGPYRSNLYLGIRPRAADSLVMGLMWSRADQASLIEKNLRHGCDEDDGIAGYGWTSYDVRTGGSQTINDARNNVNLTTHFVKPAGEGPEQWSLRTRGTLRKHAHANQKTTVVFYVGGEHALSKIECKKKNNLSPPYSDVACRGQTFQIGDFTIDVRSLKKNGSPPRKIAVTSLKVHTEAIWQAKRLFLQQLKKSGKFEGLIANKPGQGNFHFVQMTFEGDFEFDTFFSSGSASETMTSAWLTNRITEARSSFDHQFGLTYQPQAPFKHKQYLRFSQSLLSNLMGGIGYFHGTSKVDLNPDLTSIEVREDFWMKAEEAQSNVTLVEERGPYQLYTAVPSRSLFARGFAWDEGFHLQVILEWDMDLALEMASSWLSVMDEDGWIAREQILGSEGRNEIPEQFQIQYPQHANPPTLFFVLQAFAERLHGKVPYSGYRSEYLDNPTSGKEFLMAIYPKLKKHYDWFRQTQAGNLTSYQISDVEYKHAYRWRGRTPGHTLTSGLYDYPRAANPHPDELHIDALSWVGAMANALEAITYVIGQDDDHKTFLQHKADIMQSIEDIHWSDRHHMYCDTTVGTTDVVEHVCHKGYISLFPFLTGLMGPAHPHLGAVLDLIRNPGELWSSFGVRSLSRNDKYYGSDENYWRSPIWININYMILQQLLSLSAQPGPLEHKIKTIYDELRVNLVNTVFKSWQETGSAWEQYNPDNGKGQRTQHFTGWTALIVKIMAFPELKSTGRPHLCMPKLQSEDGGVLGLDNISLLVVVAAMLLLCLAYRRKLMLVVSKVHGLYEARDRRTS